MLRRLRKLRISLATKCQLLFGAAGVLIIAAALFVPWTRMEQLTRQLDEAAARAVARTAVAQHAADAAPLPSPLLAPATRPTQILALDGGPHRAPRLVGSASFNPPDALNPFEKRAAEHFIAHPDKTSYGRPYVEQGVAGYRYAEPLRFGASCLACHAPLPAPTTQSALLPDASPIVGLISVDIPSQISTRQLLLNRVFLITAGLFAGAVGILVLYVIITRLILQPVRVLQDAAERVRAGDLDVRADVPSGDEFQQFSETFNAMLAGLKSTADQLRAANVSLDQKLDQLAETNLALYESNRLKSEFLASVSHELRTPLNSILGFAQLLKESGDGNPRVARYVQNIAQSGTNLLDLINDLLDLAKIEAGRMEVRSEPLSLPDLFEALVGVLKPLTLARPVEVAESVDADVPILRTDPAKLQQILYNLLSNAIKFSPKGGTIRLAASREGPEHIRLSVTDEGPGVPPGQHETIFEKFRQADASVTRQHGGTGLGLTISMELAHLLGGELGVDSDPGRGATFWCVLPVAIEAESKLVTRKPLRSA